jgi:Ni/Co efflux regulator RcnB
MKTKPIVSLLVGALMGLMQASAFAEPGYGNNSRNGNGNNNTSHCGNGRPDCGGNQGGRNQGWGANNRGPQDSNHADNERGAGPGRSYYRGDRMPMQYRGRQYVVDDWRGHGLRTPPRGYHWVQSGGDYVLVAIATGVILDLLLSR